MSDRQQRKESARAEREARERAEEQAARRRTRLLQLGSVVAIAAAVVVVLVLVSQGSKPDPNASSGASVQGVSDSRAMLGSIAQDGTSLGDPEAPLVLTEFADLQCPFCRDYALNVLPTVIERYVRPGKLRLELRLRAFIGPDSAVAARAANAAATRDRMWNFVDLFYRNQGQENAGYVTDPFLSRLATAAGLPARLIIDGSKSIALQSPVREADAQAQAAGLASTPSFLIGPKAGTGRKLEIGGLSPDEFTTAIDAELDR